MVPGWWGRQRLRDRVRLVFASTGLVLVVIVGFALFNMGRLASAVRSEVDRLDPAAVSSRDLSRSLLDQQTGMRGYVLSTNEVFLQPYLDGTRDEQAASGRLRTESAARWRPTIQPSVRCSKAATSAREMVQCIVSSK